MNIKNLIFRRIKRTVKKRDFWFAITVYPVFALGYWYANNNQYLFQLVEKVGVWYFVISFALFLYIIFLVVFEVIEKKFLHKVQGDKLRIKQQQEGR